MASNGPPQTPTAPGSSDAPMNDSPPKYRPQFSATTEMILERMKSGATASFSSIGITGTPPGYEDMRRSVLQGMKTSMNMEIPSTPPAGRGRGGRSGGSGSASRASATPTNNTPGGSASGKGKAAAKSKGRAGTKRKRARDEEESTEESDDDMSKLGGDSESDDEESVTELPKITQSGRQVNKPAQFIPAAYENPPKRRAPSRRSQENALCKRCGRGHSPKNNEIVFCDGCNLGWHQMCHDPQISAEAVKDESTQWFCADCSKKKGIKPKAPSVEPIKGVSGEGKTAEQKRIYLSSQTHQQLVSLLMQALILHPNLPIFPPNWALSSPTGASTSTGIGAAAAPLAYSRASSTTSSRTHNHPQPPFPPSTTPAGLFARVEANPKAPINFIRKIGPGSGPGVNPGALPATLTHSSSAPPSLPTATALPEDDDSRESTPASPPYPKPGTGLMAKLGPDDADLEWLVDGDDFDAFSHVVFNEGGEKVEENGVPVGTGVVV